jgi:TolB protein
MWKLFAALLLAAGLASVVIAQEASLPGSIAYIGADYNVYTLREGTSYALTSDGSRGHAYQWVTWSRDGRLAYFCCDIISADTFETGIFISGDGVTPGRNVRSTYGEPVIYATWAPATCGGSSACRDLAVLLNPIATSELRYALIRDTQNNATTSIVGSGAPFYTTFSADGTRMLLHRYNRNLDVYDIASESIIRSIEGGSSGTFQTAAFSPVDDRILIGRPGAARGRTDLALIEGDEIRVIVSDLRGFVSFLWSPDGRYIAYRVATRGTLTAVTVVDAATGNPVVTSQAEDVVAFFWSPDSQRLALLRVGGSAQAQAGIQRTVAYAAQNSAPQVSWVVLEVPSGDQQTYQSFVPNYEMTYLANYFDQFAVSHQVWSPDSRYLVYTELAGIAQKPVVRVLDTLSGERTLIAEGSFAVWSYR